MDKNQFVAFRALFNERLYNALQDKDIEQIEAIINTEYEVEVAEGVFKESKLSIAAIQEEYSTHEKKIGRDSSLIYKL